MVEEKDLYPYPRFSLAERDRRWAAVRALMAAQNIDVIVCPSNTGHSTDFQANSRYLSHCGGGGDADISVVFPLTEEVTVAATSADPRWTQVQNWVTDVREARRNYGKIVVERLKELGVEHGKIGVAGLGGGTRTPEGSILYQPFKLMLDAFPDAEIVDATDILAEVREVKSEEEIDALRISNQMVDAAYDAVFNKARVGVKDYEVWAESIAAMVRLGSELPVHSNWVSGAHPARTLTRPSHRVLEHGDIILNEIESSWMGYRAQGDQPIAVAQAHPNYVELMKFHKAVHDQIYEKLLPGVTVGELAQLTQEICARERPNSGLLSDAKANLTMHGRGQGDDGPIIAGAFRSPKQLARELKPSMVFIFKPSVALGDGSFPIVWGDSIVIREQRPERLGTRKQDLWVTPG